MHRRRWLTLIGIAVIALGGYALQTRQAAAQSNPTPLPFNPPTKAPVSPTVNSPTPSRTATNVGSPVLEVLDPKTPGNVRARPDINALIIGKIEQGKFYAVLGKYGQWYEITLDEAQGTVGWVYEAIVKLSGPVKTIPLVTPGSGDDTIATLAPQLTGNAITRTPGAPASATALRLSATGVRAADNPKVTATNANAGPKPTFTYPPPLVEATLAPRSGSGSAAAQGGVPPILPILGLAALGALGLLASGLRRL